MDNSPTPKATSFHAYHALAEGGLSVVQLWGSGIAYHWQPLASGSRKHNHAAGQLEKHTEWAGTGKPTSNIYATGKPIQYDSLAPAGP